MLMTVQLMHYFCIRRRIVQKIEFRPEFTRPLVPRNGVAMPVDVRAKRDLAVAEQPDTVVA